jgi:hypothetical protein
MDTKQSGASWTYGKWVVVLVLALALGANLGVMLELAQSARVVGEADQSPPVALTPALAPQTGVVMAADAVPTTSVQTSAGGGAPADAPSPATGGVDVQVVVQASVESGQQGRVRAVATGPQSAQVAANVNGAGNAAARISADQGVEVQAHSDGTGAVEAEAAGPGSSRARAFVDGAGAQALQPSGQPGTLPSTLPSTLPGTLPAISPSPLLNSGGAVGSSVTRVAVSGSLVNVREGPGQGYPIITQVSSGQQLQVLGRSTDGNWWQVCCVNNAVGWLASQYATPVDPVGGLPLAIPQAPVMPAPVINLVPTLTPTPPPPTLAPAPAVPTPTLEFAVIRQEQFAEQTMARLYAFVEDITLYSGAGGYRMRVRKDGVDLPNSEVSFAGIPLLTWPWTHDDRQRPYNLKLEFRDIVSAGNWQITPLDSLGREVGPTVAFQLAPNDPKQEMYVRFQRRAN